MVILGVIGPWQLAIVVIALLLLFGGKKIPELMRGLGQGMSEFKKSMNENQNSQNEDANKKIEH